MMGWSFSILNYLVKLYYFIFYIIFFRYVTRLRSIWNIIRIYIWSPDLVYQDIMNLQHLKNCHDLRILSLVLHFYTCMYIHMFIITICNNFTCTDNKLC